MSHSNTGLYCRNHIGKQQTQQKVIRFNIKCRTIVQTSHADCSLHGRYDRWLRSAVGRKRKTGAPRKHERACVGLSTWVLRTGR